MKLQSLQSVYRRTLDAQEVQKVFGVRSSLALVVAPVAELGKEAGANYLGNGEKEQLSSYTYPKRKAEWLSGRLAAKYAALIIDSPGHIEFQDRWLRLEIKSRKNGRPYIRDTRQPERSVADISISHSHGMAAGLAFAHGRCGVDIQKITPTVEKVKERFADVAEEAVVAALPLVGPGTRSLTILWAVKEALRKAVGTEVLPGYFGIKVRGARQGLSGGPLGEYMILDCSLIPQQGAGEKSTATSAVAALFLEEYVLAFTGLILN